jgi:hypothetical protein
MTTESQALINELNDLINKPGGGQAIRFVLNGLGSVPAVGGIIAGAGNLWGEKEQQKFNEKITELASTTSESIRYIQQHLASQLQDTTKAHMSLLLGEVTGVELPSTSPEDGNWGIRVMLNSETIRELKVFERQGWLKLISNGCTATMGSGNVAGGCIEDKKSPWGIGSGFYLTVENSYYL